MTAFYMFRLFYMTFKGQSRVEEHAAHHIHEAPWTMLYVLVALAALSVVGGWIGVPAALGGSNHFEHFLAPVVAQVGVQAGPPAASAHHDPMEYALMVVSVGIALAGIWLARWMYTQRTEMPETLAQRFPRLYQLVYRKYYVDELYDALFVNRSKDLASSLGAFDRTVIDGFGVDGSAWLTRFSSRVSIWWDTWIVDGLVNLSARIVWLFSFPARLIQTGLVQSYALLIVLGVLLSFGYFVWMWTR
jgi:NADH-quinone oxidoreductase subunit L